MRKIKIFIAMRIFYNLFKLVPIKPKRILFEASQGRFTSNPKYLYLQMRDDRRFDDYQIIWALKESDTNISSIKIYSLTYIFYLATSNILINDNMWHPYMKKRKGQLFIQTWHGTPLKMIALDTNNPSGDPKVTKQNESYVLANTKLFDFVTSSSEYTTSKFKTSFNFKGLIAPVGTSRVDYLLANKNQPKSSKYKSFDRVILIAPSFRKSLKGTDQYQFFYDNFEIDKLANTFPNYCFLLKLHNYAFDQARIAKNNIIDVSGTDDINQLYLDADCLITDYSSTMFDYSVLERCTICYPFDYDFKTQMITTDQEQLYLPLDEKLPAHIAEDQIQLIELLTVLPPKAKGIFTNYESALASERTLDFIYNNS